MKWYKYNISNCGETPYPYKEKRRRRRKNEKIPHTGDTNSLIIKGNTGSVLLSAPPNMTYGVKIIKMEVNSNNELCYTAGNWFTGLPVIQYGRQLWDPGFSVPFSSAWYGDKCELLAPG